jgi:hypothetical protein
VQLQTIVGLGVGSKPLLGLVRPQSLMGSMSIAGDLNLIVSAGRQFHVGKDVKKTSLILKTLSL